MSASANRQTLARLIVCRLIEANDSVTRPLDEFDVSVRARKNLSVETIGREYSESSPNKSVLMKTIKGNLNNVPDNSDCRSSSFGLIAFT